MDPIAIPAILAYKDGDLIANLVSLVDELPPATSLRKSSLEALLQKSDNHYTPTFEKGKLIDC